MSSNFNRFTEEMAVTLDRRLFLKWTAAAVPTAALAGRAGAETRLTAGSGRFRVHPFVDENPDAVFVLRTSVPSMTDGPAKRQAGLDFGRSVFVPCAEGGFPLTAPVAIKPNLTSRGKWSSKYTLAGSLGVVTDAYFVEGVIESLKALGLAGSQVHLREVNSPEDFADGGYRDVARRTGADLRDLDAEVGSLAPADVVWSDVPGGVFFARLPHLWPVNAPETFFLNIAKFKTHAMGVTLCAKNLQGTIAHNYQAHCTAYSANMDVARGDLRSDAKAVILENHRRRVADGVPRWDRPGTDHTSGLGMETWATRCLDNNSVLHPDLHVVEGIVGRDGHFMDGPHPGGLAQDVLANVVLFGRNPFHVDLLGHWLAGHEPGNFGLFHMALERGLSRFLNPADLPVYAWTAEGAAVQTSLDALERIPLVTGYLRRDYGGQSEPAWHLCDEPYAYAPLSVARDGSAERPECAVLMQNYPNPFNPSTAIAFRLPRAGRVRLEILNARGQAVDRLAAGARPAGAHLAVWDASRHPAGTYLARLLFEGHAEIRRLSLVR